MNPLWGTYRALAPFIGALAPAASVFTSPAERVLWKERLGQVSRPGGCHAWVHAASLGEAVAAAPLVRELLRHQPDARLHLTASTGDPTRAHLPARDRAVAALVAARAGRAGAGGDRERAHVGAFGAALSPARQRSAQCIGRSGGRAVPGRGRPAALVVARCAAGAHRHRGQPQERWPAAARGRSCRGACSTRARA
ncbi:MAG: hypothetical protein K8R56_02970 [Candidatus Eisenbacteria bacterium]|nr:hypothetical protein [Candidatus Eisenbacteria bacterium]